MDESICATKDESTHYAAMDESICDTKDEIICATEDESICATNFVHKSSTTSSATYIADLVKHSKSKHTTGCVSLAGSAVHNVFENYGDPGFSQVWNLLKHKVLLTVKSSTRGDSRNELEQLRCSVLPLVELFTQNQGAANVQKYYGVDYTKAKSRQPGAFRTCYILSEFCEGTPLNELMSLQHNAPNDILLTEYAKQVLKGLEFLHANRIVHGDIRGANILILKNADQSDSMRVKIIGLASAIHLDKNSIQARACNYGTIPFVSPEVAELSAAPLGHRPRIGPKSDIWSFGCLMIEAIQNGKPPLFARKGELPIELSDAQHSLQEVDKHFRNGYLPLLPSATDCQHGCRPRCLLMTEEMVTFITICLVTEPERRKDATQLLKSPYISCWFVQRSKGAKEIQRFEITRCKLENFDVSTHNSIESLVEQIEQEELEKVSVPGNECQEFASGWVSFVSPIPKASIHSIEHELENKRRVFDLLMTPSASANGQIVRHVAVTLHSPVELRVITDRQGCSQTLDQIINQEQIVRQISDFTKQILDGLTFLYENHIIHKDIRPANIFVEKLPPGMQKYRLEIANFEKASCFTESKTPDDFIKKPEGSPDFASTEMHELVCFGNLENQMDHVAEKVGRKTDVFSLGCTVIEMFRKDALVREWRKERNLMPKNLLEYFVENPTFKCGSKPHTGDDDANLENTIFGNNRWAVAFVQLCFSRSASRRPCYSLLTHEFIKGAAFEFEILNEQHIAALGLVGKVRRVDNNQPLETRHIRDYSGQRKHHLEMKLDCIIALKHPNLLRHIHDQPVELDKSLLVFMEYCGGGTLHECVEQLKQDLSPQLMKKWTQQLFDAVKYLHEKSIVHKAINPSNILLSSMFNHSIDQQADTDSCNLKISLYNIETTADIIIREQSTVQHGTRLCEPLRFMAPEVLRGEHSKLIGIDREKCDIWSLGCVVVEMATRNEPQYFSETTTDRKGQPVALEKTSLVPFVGNRPGVKPDFPASLAGEVQHIIAKCTVWDTPHRPSAAEIMETKYLKDRVTLDYPDEGLGEDDTFSLAL